MPSRSGFSIRKLFSPPRRPSHTSDGPSAAAAAAASATALPRLSLDRTEHITIDTINTINTTTITDHSDAHSDDDGLHPDSSITTPQAEHGLIDTVAHELSQDEIDRIKAVVAAAAADAASNLRLRMQAEDAANTADTADDTADTTTATTPIDITALPEPLRKKSRRGRVPQPIVVPPRSLSLASGTRASRANSRCSNCRPAQHHRVNQSDGILAINSSEPEKRKAHLPATPPPSSSSQPLSEKGVGVDADRRVISGTCSSGSSAVKERQVQAQPQLLLFPATTTAGNSKSDRSSDSSDPNGEVRRQRQQQKKQGDNNNNNNAAAFVDGQPLALPLNRLHPLSAPLMATASTTTSTTTTTPLHPPSTRAPLSKPVVLNGISSASTSISKSTSISQLSSSSPPHPAGLIFDPPPTLHPRSSQLATSLTTSSSSSSSAAHRRPSLFSSARRRDAPLPATPKSTTTKAIPPRSKLRPRSRTSKKPKARPRSLRSGTSSKSGGSSRLGHRKPKVRQAAIQSPLEAEAVDQFDPESLIHPVYRGQYAQPDGKTDSGISLNNKNPLGIIDKETLLRSRSNSHNSHSAASDFSDAASNACLNLLQALAIQPEEADQLHASELAKAHHAHHAHHAHAANMPSLDSTRSNAHLPDKADVRRLSDPPTTPTFTRPRRAPSPSVSSMMPSSPPLIKSPSLPVTPPYSPPAATKKKASSFPSPPPLPVEAKKQARFLPALRLTKGSTAAAAAAPVAAGHGGGHGGSSSSSGSSRWALPGNVSEFINGRLFNRMEVVETLPFEKLKAIRESRALSEQQQKERTVKETLKREAEAEDKKDKQDKVDAERAAQPETTEDKPKIKTGKDKDEDEAEAEVEEYEVSPLESDTPLAHMTQEQLASLGLAVSPTSPDTPPQSPRSSYNGSAHRNGGGPPAQPLPPVPHIASQMVPQPNRLSTVDSLVSGTTQPGDDMSPLEPFHLQDLPSRIDAASLRMSILLPVEEEEAYFASSVAKHKERRRREVEEAKVKAEAEAEAEAEAPPPPPPSKNPLRFSLPEHQATAMAPVPQLTVTDVDRDGQPSCPVGVVPAPLSPRPPRHPKNHNKKKKAAAIKDKSARAGHRAVRSTGNIPTSSLATAFQRDEETYVYLPATPYSLVMSTFRHGPVRLLRPEHDSLYFRRGSSGDGISLTSASPISPHRKHMAAVDDTLDWTAFQMAILGGAGDFFQDSVDFGRTSAAEADEAESLHQWCVSMGFDRERLVRSEADEHDSAASQAAKVSVPAPAPSSTSAPTPALTNYQHAHWASFGSASDMGSSGANTRHSGHSGLSGHSGAFYGSTHTYSASTLSVAAAVPGRQEMPASRTPSPSLYSGHAASASASGPVEILGTEIPGELPCTEIPGELPCTEIPGELPGSLPEPSQQQQQHRKNTASCASFDSYVSMPQSPMADLVMTRGADGKEYVAPMGYNLGHDLGDFLRWETENVCAMDGM